MHPRHTMPFVLTHCTGSTGLLIAQGLARVSPSHHQTTSSIIASSGHATYVLREDSLRGRIGRYLVLGVGSRRCCSSLQIRRLGHGHPLVPTPTTPMSPPKRPQSHPRSLDRSLCAGSRTDIVPICNGLKGEQIKLIPIPKMHCVSRRKLRALCADGLSIQICISGIV